MHLSAKFSLLLSSCVLLAVFFTSASLSRYFVKDQEAYLEDFQTSLALFVQKELDTQVDILYLQLGTLLTQIPFDDLMARLDGVIGGEVWEGNHLLASYNEKTTVGPPPVGTSRWSLQYSPFNSEVSSVRWLGRYKSKTLVLDLKEQWFGHVLESTHGAMVELVQEDGTILLRSVSGTPSSPGRESFRNVGVTQAIFGQKFGSPITKKYDSVDKKPFLGTFLLLGTEPGVLIAISTPHSVIQQVIERTYKQSAWIGVLFILLSIALGTGFSANLTAPLQALARQTVELAKGKFDTTVHVGTQRGDEVGKLARSFNKMSHELQKLREDLRRTERLAALGKFSAAIAHEIKNPLATILGNAQLAKDLVNPTEGPVDSETLRQTMGFIEEETLRANKTILQLMKFARQEKAPQTSMDIADRIRRSLAILRSLIDKAEIKVTDEISQSPISCLGNGDEIHEVFMNFVQNAMHAMKDAKDKHLKISLTQNAGTIRLVIKDSGHGILPEAKQHLFEPFFTTKGIGHGTGLGLAVCHGIVTNHRGKIEVESELGQGTAFIVTLPTAAQTKTQEELHVAA